MNLSISWNPPRLFTTQANNPRNKQTQKRSLAKIGIVSKPDTKVRKSDFN